MAVRGHSLVNQSLFYSTGWKQDHQYTEMMSGVMTLIALHTAIEQCPDQTLCTLSLRPDFTTFIHPMLQDMSGHKIDGCTPNKSDNLLVINSYECTHSFSIFFLISTSFSTWESSNCCCLNWFLLRATPHSGHGAEGRVNTESIQASQLHSDNKQGHLTDVLFLPQSN